MVIVGTGNQAFEYAKIMKHLGIQPIVIGNTEKGCTQFRDRLHANGIVAEVLPGRLEGNRIPTESMIVAVPVMELFSVSMMAILSTPGLKYLLIEKPGGLYTIQMRALLKASEKSGIGVWIAYNRRFYSSVLEARRIVMEEGIGEIECCFGEPMREVMKSRHPDTVKRRWLIANSSHLIDAALFISGKMASGLKSNVHGNQFAGQFEIPQGKLIYHTDWDIDKRWKIRIKTAKGNTYHLGPIETLLSGRDQILVQEGSGPFKAGMLPMVRSFLSTREHLPTVREQLDRMIYYCQMGGMTE